MSNRDYEERERIDTALSILNAKSVSVATQQVAEKVLCQYLTTEVTATSDDVEHFENEIWLDGERIVVPANIRPGQVIQVRPRPTAPVDASMHQLAALVACEQLLRKYLGLPEDKPVRDLVMTYPAQFHSVVDLRQFARALGGEWTELVDRVEKEAAERKANTKAYEAGAGIALGKES